MDQDNPQCMDEDLQKEKYAKMLKWVAYDPDFMPARLDKQFRQWVYNGITFYCTITNNGVLESFCHF